MAKAPGAGVTVSVHLGIIALGVVVLALTPVAAEAYYDEVRRSIPVAVQPSRRRCRSVDLLILLDDLACSGVILGGMPPERSHWAGGGRFALLGLACPAGASTERNGAYKLPLALVATTAFAAAGWRLSVPPADEEVADKRICRRGLGTIWKPLDGESHVVSLSFERADSLKGVDINALLIDRCRLPHLKRVFFSFPERELPDGVSERLAAGLPGAEVSIPGWYVLRQLKKKQEPVRTDGKP